jgi:hypothetical protein
MAVTYMWVYASLALGTLFCGLAIRAFVLWKDNERTCAHARSCPSITVTGLYLVLSILGLSVSRIFRRAFALEDTREAHAHLWRTGHYAGMVLGVVYVTYIALRVMIEEGYVARFNATTAAIVLLLSLSPFLYVALTSTVLRGRLLRWLHESEVQPKRKLLREAAVEEQSMPVEVTRLADLQGIAEALKPQHDLHRAETSPEPPQDDASSCSSDDTDTDAELAGFDFNRSSTSRYATCYHVLPEYKNERLASLSLEYLGSPSQRHPYLLRVASGLLVDADGAPLNCSRQNREALYVVCVDGEVLISYDLNKHHHSSLAAGGAVAAAGMMRIAEGRIFAIDNLSGHYRPDASSLRVVMEHLQALGVPLEHVEWQGYAKDQDAVDATPLPCFTKDSMVNIVRPAVQVAQRSPVEECHAPCVQRS